MIKVSIVVPAYNAIPYFESFLSSIYCQNRIKFEVIWVDSSSTDESVQKIRVQFPQTKIIELKSNAGYRRAANIGAREAQGEYLVICNQDTKVECDWLGQLVSSAETQLTVGIVAPKILMYDDPGIINEVGNTLHFTGLYGSRGLGAPATMFNVPEVIATVSGCCFLIRRALWEKLGGFSEDFDQFDTGWHASYEDVDLAMRAQLLGYKVVYCPQALMYHDYKSKGMIPERFCSYEWGRYLFILRNYELKTLILLIPMLVALELGSWLYAVAMGRPWLMSKIRVMNWFMRNGYVLNTMRSRVQSMRVVDDRVLIARMSSKISLTHVMPQNYFTNLLQDIVSAIFRIYYLVILILLGINCNKGHIAGARRFLKRARCLLIDLLVADK